MSLDEFRLEPQRATVTAGRFTAEVANRGEAVHALAIEAPDGQQATQAIDPGRAATLEAELRAGRYVWYCPVGDHRSRGMEGVITVQRGKGGRAPAPDGVERDTPSVGGY